jgi:hypothetical protein
VPIRGLILQITSGENIFPLMQAGNCTLNLNVSFSDANSSEVLSFSSKSDKFFTKLFQTYSCGYGSANVGFEKIYSSGTSSNNNIQLNWSGGNGGACSADISGNIISEIHFNRSIQSLNITWNGSINSNLYSPNSSMGINANMSIKPIY